MLFIGLASSCISSATAEKRLAPVRSTSEFRMQDIERYAREEPVKAIHLIGMYRTIYGTENAHPELSESDMPAVLTALEGTAVENLKAAQSLAITEKRWEDAASMSRSLAVMGIAVESTGAEPGLILAQAREQLTAGNDLAAFLGAVRAHALKPLEFDDARLFLDRAVELKQRRTAAFFLTAADTWHNGASRGIPQSYRTFIAGQDSKSDMIKGVATVLIDRGIKIERGRGFSDKVLGSAFFVDASGLLITNYHVIASEVDPTYEGYSRMTIRMGDSSSARIPAKVVGWDKAMDLALIKAEIRPEYVFSVVDRINPQVGDAVLAIGSPGGLEKTVTQGIVSALGRRFLQIGDVIQIDASVNHGNSGGPVVDMEGRLVGIVFAGIESYPGLNFAVPAERLAAALPTMIAGGKAVRPWLGLTISETAGGAEIIYVAPFTPASEQQIPEGTLIKTINGHAIQASQGALIPALQDVLYSDRPGELVVLETSDGARHIIMTAPRPDIPLAAAAKIDRRERLAAPLYGLILTPTVGNTVAASYQIKKVVRGSIADEAGLSEQDPISIRGFRVEEEDGYSYALMDINVKKRRMGYLETTMRLPALLDLPDTL
ncbi:trypsin [Spirochaetia bacterium]|nr:trypsin [Spirochaetia bacterium]